MTRTCLAPAYCDISYCLSLFGTRLADDREDPPRLMPPGRPLDQEPFGEGHRRAQARRRLGPRQGRGAERHPGARPPAGIEERHSAHRGPGFGGCRHLQPNARRRHRCGKAPYRGRAGAGAGVWQPDSERRKPARRAGRYRAGPVALRYVHLSAHAEDFPLLTGNKIARYNALRATAPILVPRHPRNTTRCCGANTMAAIEVSVPPRRHAAGDRLAAPPSAKTPALCRRASQVHRRCIACAPGNRMCRSETTSRRAPAGRP